MISVILFTCKEDDAIIGMPETPILQPVIQSLNNQTFRDFELIIVDDLRERRYKDILSLADFPVKHVDPKPNIWLDLGMWHLSNNLNTGVLYAEGELIIFLGDSEYFNNNYLSRMWRNYLKGYYTLSAFDYVYKGELIRNTPESLGKVCETKEGWNWVYGPLGVTFPHPLSDYYAEGEPIMDLRYKQVPTDTFVAPHEWYYGISSISLDEILRINGSDENFDGCKGIEDQDIGSRLDMLPTNYQFLYDKHCLIHEYPHKPSRVVAEPFPWRNSKAVYDVNRRNRIVEANRQIYSISDVEYILAKSLEMDNEYFLNTGNHCYNEKLFNLWVDHQPHFSLEEMMKV